jgi:voltage-gated potassium channel
MIPLLLALRALARALVAVWRDPETRALPLVAGGLVVIGTVFYWQTEDWTIVEALYFSVMTLTTIGFGDFVPTNAETQLFTIGYVLIGLGIFVALLASVAEQYLKQRAAAGAAVRERLRAMRSGDEAG